MKAIVLVLAFALASALPTAAAATAPREASCAPLSECLEPVIRIVRCIGDALNGHACHDAPTLAAQPPLPDPEAILTCVGVAIQNWLEGITPEPCTIY